MNWQKKLRHLEQNKQWDEAIEFMQDIIEKNPDNLDVYLSIAYLLMNLIVEEDYDRSKGDYYRYLTKKYYNESYKKFSHDPKYLFYIGRIAVMSEWFFGIDTEDYEKMLRDAARLEPNNLLYQWVNCDSMHKSDLENRKNVRDYAKAVLAPNSPIPKILDIESSLGEYIFEIITSWSKKMLKTGGLED
jgi:tetratricopeptide (TPR) repeat protein